MINIKNKADCCGCSSCMSICPKDAIYLEEDKHGFLYPHIDSTSCINCGLCEKSCPIIQRDNQNFVVNQQEIYACHDKDNENWQSSSSGGIFGLIARNIFSKNGYVVGAIYDNEMNVKHFIAKSYDEMKKIRGSKYVQSNLRGIYPQIKKLLDQKKWVLFSGTPCQVEGLKCYLQKYYPTLVTCDLICTSVPSPKVWHDYIRFCEKKINSKIVNVNMKDKTNGWPFAKTRIFLNNGKTIINTLLSDLWIKIWASKLIDRPSCEACRFTNYNRPGDLTIGDFWAVFHQKHPFFNKNGISQLMVNTDKGRTLYNEIKGGMIAIQTTKEFAWQSKLEYPTKNNPLEEQFWEDYNAKGFNFIIKKYFDYHPIRHRLKSYKQYAKHIIKRIITKK